MKILIVTSLPSFYSGGIKTHIKNLSSSLDKLHINHNVLYLDKAKTANRLRYYRVSKNINFPELINVASQSYKVWLMKKSIEQQIDNGSYSLIHVHDIFAAYAALSVAYKKLPILFTMHGCMIYEMLSIGAKENSMRMKGIKRYEKIACEKSDACIAVSSNVNKVLLNDYKIPSDRVHIVLNAIDIENVVQISKRLNMYKIPSRYFIVPRRLVPTSGVEYAIRALALSKIKHQLLILGTGSLRNEIEELAIKLNVNDQIDFLGDVANNDLLAIMADSMGVIIPSVPIKGAMEGTSMAILEAMALKRPIIASNIGGIMDILRSNKNAYITNPRDAYAIAKRMDEISKAKELEIKKRTNQCFKILTKYHSLSILSANMNKIYMHYSNSSN